MDQIQSISTRNASCALHGPFESRPVLIFGKPLGWSKCPDCVKLDLENEEKERNRRAEKARQESLEKRLNMAGIPRRFRSRSFDTFVADTKPMAEALQIAKEFALTFDDRAAEGSTTVFSGKPGTGKSHLAISVCLEIMRRGHTAMYMNAMDVFLLVRSTWERNTERKQLDVMKDLATVDLLVLDEIGAQYGTESEQLILFGIINSRYQDQRPMILITNQGKEGFRQYLGDRAFDRLREAGRWVPFDWESHRGKL